MKLSIIGTGYVGLVQGACFADTGNDVICMDIEAKKIEMLQQGKSPIYEPGLEELVRHNLHEGRLWFTTSLETAVKESEIIFLCLPTPQNEDGSADVERFMSVSGELAAFVNGPKIVVSKSTVPVGTADRLDALMRERAQHPVTVVSNPEFLKEGSAVEDSMKPDRVVLGSSDPRAVAVLSELYAPFVRTGAPIVVMDERSAEVTKYAANGLLATKVTFMNEVANLCERVGADVDLVRRGIGADPRIGKQFLFAGIGYGGSCFPKDVKALATTAAAHGYRFRILEAVDAVNEDQKALLVKKARQHFGTLQGKTIAVWGLSFKPRTDDIREAPSRITIECLLKEGARVRANDPVAIPAMRAVFGATVEFFENSYDALAGADALMVVTEWNEYRRPDFERMRSLMNSAVVFDGRNIYEPAAMRERGFVYYGVGRRMP